MGNEHLAGMPAFTDPDFPEAAGGTVNLSPDESPVPHDPSYGESAPEPEGASEQTPENREDWKKEDWKNQAAAYGLPVSGNMDELQERVEDYEAENDIVVESPEEE